jgi:hypothetical protein
VYERKIGDRVLTIGNDRFKIEESLVVYDVETGTQWILATGKAFRGELKGEAMKPLPAELTRFSAWKTSHPDGLVLTGRRPNAPRNRIYVLDPAHLAELLLVARVGTAVRGYPFDLLDRRGLIEDDLVGTPVAVVFSRDPDCMRVYRRELGGRPIALELVRRAGAVILHERAGAREWDAATGRALGEASAPALEALPAFPMLRERLHPHFHTATVYVDHAPKDEGK